MKGWLAFLISIFFWIPVIGTALSAIALTLGISEYKKEKGQILSIIAIILSVLGLLLPIFLVVLGKNAESGIIYQLMIMGILDVWIPFMLIVLLIGMIIFFILEIVSLKTLRNSIISLSVASVIGLFFSIQHVLGLGPMGGGLVMIIWSALPRISIFIAVIDIILLAIYLFVIRKKKNKV